MSNGWGGARPGAGRTRRTLLDLVQYRTFSARNTRHRLLLLEDLSLLELDDRDERLEQLASLQELYRRDTTGPSATFVAQRFEEAVRSADNG